MRQLIFIIALIFLITSVSAVRINEIEINPSGGSNGNEWVEIYNDGESDTDISGWEIWEGVYGSSGPRKIQSIPDNITIQKGELYVIEWSGSKLNNGGDFVILYDSNSTKIDETENLEETTSSTKTHQYCAGEWQFLEQTKNSENACPEETPENQAAATTNETQDDEDIVNEENDLVVEANVNISLSKNNKKSSSTPETIDLNPQNIKSGSSSESLSKEDYALYGLVIFSVLLCVLFFIKTKRYTNEFNKNGQR